MRPENERNINQGQKRCLLAKMALPSIARIYHRMLVEKCHVDKQTAEEKANDLLVNGPKTRRMMMEFITGVFENAKDL